MGLGLIYKTSNMKKIMKPGRVVILLAGRRAGKKAVIVKQFDDGKKGKTFGHALVAGVERAPMRVTRRMSKKKITRRSTLKPFAKIVNYNHILPTRFQVTGEFAQGGKELKTIVSEDRLANKETKKHSRTKLRTSSPKDTTTQTEATISRQPLTSSSSNSNSERGVY